MKKLYFLSTTLFSLLILISNSVGQTPSAEWVKTYSGNARELIVDNQNNILVSGTTPTKKGRGFLTIKYNVNGQQLWSASYNGPGNDDYVYGLTADANGYVYITGQSAGQAGTADYATIKYDPNGQSVWVKRYNGTLNTQDFARDVKVDGSGYVYVTGFANGEANNIFRGKAIITIKYNPDGSESWVRSYDVSPSGGVGNSIALDASGNIYVAGENNGGTVLLKYDGYGELLWTQNTPGGYGSGANALIDGAGNIVVSSGSEIFKYDPDGNLIWHESFNASFYDLAFDASNNVYATGFANDLGYSDYMTVKYNAGGGLAWSRRFNGTANSTDIGRSIALDNAGNVYVTGLCSMGTSRNSTGNYGTVKYNSDGVQQWLALYPGNAFGIGVDVSGNIYVTGETSAGKNSVVFGTIKYPAGTTTTSKSITNLFATESIQANFSVQNYPNPFSQSTIIEYQIPKEANVKLSVYDLQGKQVATLVNKTQSPGIYRINFSAGKLSAGTYIYKIQAGEFIETKRLVVIR